MPAYREISEEIENFMDQVEEYIELPELNRGILPGLHEDLVGLYYKISNWPDREMAASLLKPGGAYQNAKKQFMALMHSSIGCNYAMALAYKIKNIESLNQGCAVQFILEEINSIEKEIKLTSIRPHLIAIITSGKPEPIIEIKILDFLEDFQKENFTPSQFEALKSCVTDLIYPHCLDPDFQFRVNELLGISESRPKASVKFDKALESNW